MAELEKLLCTDSKVESLKKINAIIENGGGGTGLQMFDTILKDHILTYEESKGLALQGTWVYKEAIVGSRYGYPDFYNKCLEEFNEAIPRVANLAGNDITLYEHSNGHRYYDISEKSKIDNFFNAAGTAWVYGVDKENERIFLPRNIWFDQVSMDEVGASVQAGLPNITGNLNLTACRDAGADGAFTQSLGNHIWSSGNGGSSTNYVYNNFDASRSSDVYGKSNTVQPRSVKKLLYICVGNTESQSTITDVVEVTTTENDTTPLFTGLYFDFTPNNVSWLKAGQQANSGGVYTTCYNTLVNCLNGDNPYNIKVIEANDKVAGVDYSEYWVVAQDFMSFTTPTAISNKALSGAVKGNGNGLGITWGTASGTWTTNYGANALHNAPVLENNVYNQPVGTNLGSGTTADTVGLAVGIVTDSSNSGIVAEQATSNLYFKVANAVQNLELLNAGEVLEAVADIATTVESTPHIVERYQNGNSWYRIWSDGWCEQGSIVQGSDAEFTFTFLKPFKTLPTINVHVYGYYSQTLLQDTANYKFISPRAVSLTGFKTWASAYGTCWEARGYIA